MKKIIVIVCVIVTACSFMMPAQHRTWTAIGDSITYLNEHQNETGNRVTKGYMTRVAEAIPDLEYINQGHNGWTSGGIAAKIDSLGLLSSNIYSVFLGTNDWWQGRPLGSMQDYTGNAGNTTVYGSFRIIVNKLKTLNAKARIILITPMQRADFVYINNMKNNAYGSYKDKNGQSLESFAEAVKAIGNYEHFEVIDLYHEHGMAVPNLVKFKRIKDPASGQYKDYPYPDYTAIPFHPEADPYPYPLEAVDVTYDGLHPSDKGYAMIAERFIELLKKN